DAAHQRVTEPRHSFQVIEHHIAQLRHARWKKISAVHWHASLHKGVIGSEFGAEINPPFQVGLAACQLAADRKGSAPRAAPARHAYFKLSFRALCEKLSTDFFHSLLYGRVYSVTDNIKEAALAARAMDFSSDFAALACSAHE